MKKYVQLGFFFAFFLAITSVGYAQTSSNKNAVSIKGVLTDYASPLSKDYFDGKNTTLGLEYKYARFLNKSFNIAFPGRAGYLRYPKSDTEFSGQSTFGSLDLNVVYKFNNDYMLNEGAFIAPYIFTGGGAEFLSHVSKGDRIDFQIPFGLGFDVKLTDNVKINVQSEYRLAMINDYNNLRHTLGFTYLFGGGEPKPEPPADRDGDGVLDMDDACPDTPGIVKFKGCPDTDSDGITDSEDGCPEEAGPEDNKGCPWGDADKDGLTDNNDDCPNEAGPEDNKGCPWGDADADGITDNVDDCPNKAGLKENNGCPVEVKDRDKDGIADADDNCPDKAGLAKFKGCPDTDGDGVMDKDDRCPSQAGLISNKGCPEIKQEVKQVLDIAMRSIQFETGSNTLKTSSYSILDQVADVLKKYPEYSCSIGGHTDNVGADTNNQTLSERRAKTCYDYLIKKGVSYSRLSYAGYGETQPIATNDTRDGRSLNRRVEFNIFIR